MRAALLVMTAVLLASCSSCVTPWRVNKVALSKALQADLQNGSPMGCVYDEKERKLLCFTPQEFEEIVEQAEEQALLHRLGGKGPVDKL